MRSIKPGIHCAITALEKWIPGPRQEARPGMTAGAQTYPGIPATEFRPGCQKSLAPKIEGAGKAGCRADTHSPVCKIKSTRVSRHRCAGTSGFPCAMVLTVSFVLSLVIGLCCHHRQRNAQALSPT